MSQNRTLENIGYCSMDYSSHNSVYLWRKIHAKDGNEYCDPETVLRQTVFRNNGYCESYESFEGWPLSEYGHEFINNNQTETCWTNCKTYITSSPQEMLQNGESYFIGAYVPLLAFTFVQIVLRLFQEGVWYLCCGKNDYAQDWLSFELIMGTLYMPYWISIVHMAAFSSSNCPKLQAGYILESCMPILFFVLYITLHTRGISLMFLYVCGSFSCILSGVLTELGPDCFEPSRCGTHVYFILVWYSLAFIALSAHFMWKNYKHYKPWILENRKRKNIMQIVERKWQGQKDIIFPLIDRREHIWNEIWTMCWGMEELFWQPDSRNEQFCDLLLAGYDGSESPAELYAFQSHRFCCMILGYYFNFNALKQGSKIAFKSVAELKGDINWQIYQSAKNLRESFGRYSYKRSFLLEDVDKPHNERMQLLSDFDELVIHGESQQCQTSANMNVLTVEMQPTFQIDAEV